MTNPENLRQAAAHDGQPAGGEQPLELVSSVCGSGSCPSIYRTNRGTLVIQGSAVPAGDVGLEIPAGEVILEIPADVLMEAAARLAGSATEQTAGSTPHR
jgi:hypothetical protein